VYFSFFYSGADADVFDADNNLQYDISLMVSGFSLWKLAIKMESDGSRLDGS
jgi:hypothetical protein